MGSEVGFTLRALRLGDQGGGAQLLESLALGGCSLRRMHPGGMYCGIVARGVGGPPESAVVGLSWLHGSADRNDSVAAGAREPLAVIGVPLHVPVLPDHRAVLAVLGVSARDFQ